MGRLPTCSMPLLARLPLGTCLMLASSQGGSRPLNHLQGLPESFLQEGQLKVVDGWRQYRIWQIPLPALPITRTHVCTHVRHLAHPPILGSHWPSL